MRISGPKATMAAWLVFTIGFSIYLLQADRVYHALRDGSYIQKLPEHFSMRAKGDLQVLNTFEARPVSNRFEEGRSFRGRLSQLADQSGKAKVRVFFRSSDAMYEVIENRRSFLGTARQTVSFFTSTSGLEAGDYTVGLYLRDDDGESFAWISNSFTKVAGGTSVYIARPVSLPPASIGETIQFSVENIYPKDIYWVVQGWVVLADAEMTDYNAYVVIQDADGVSKAFYAPLYTRMDIASRQGDDRSAHSGFLIQIPSSEYTRWPSAIQIALQSRKTGTILESRAEVFPRF